MTWHLLMKTLTVKDGERALLTRDGRLERVLGPGRHRLFDLRRQLTAEIFNVVRTEFPAERYAVLKAARPDLAAELFEAVETKANEIAIVSLDGRPVHLMTPWQARVYWKVATSVGSMSRAGWWSGLRPDGTPSGSPAARSRSSASICVPRRSRSPRRKC